MNFAKIFNFLIPRSFFSKEDKEKKLRDVLEKETEFLDYKKFKFLKSCRILISLKTRVHDFGQQFESSSISKDKKKPTIYTVQKHRKDVHDFNGKLLILRFYVLGKLEEKNCFVMYLIQNNIVTFVQNRKKK